MRAEALRRLTVQGQRVEPGEEIDLPQPLLNRFVKLGWVKAIAGPPPPEIRINHAPETRVVPKPVTGKKTKSKRTKGK